MKPKVGVGIIGCGKISSQYFLGCAAYDILEVVACADLDLARAREAAVTYRIKRGCTVQELLADPAVELVINLTIPQTHVEINEAALNAGKHVYAEKPFSLDSASGQRALFLAVSKGLLIGGAPDTFLGGGIQTARKLIDDGAIGEPVGAMASMLTRGPESWHPAPEFYYKKGGGPMFDMGPYYLTALIALMGPIKRVSGSARKTFSERLITSQPLNGKKISVDVPTHYMGVMDFVGGPVAQITTSFDVWAYPLPCMVIFGTESTLEVPDPNGFGGVVRLREAEGKPYREIPLTHSGARGRGTGVADMAYAIRGGRTHRASGELALHVVDVMESFEHASESGRYVEIASTCRRPAALPTGLPDHALDE